MIKIQFDSESFARVERLLTRVNRAKALGDDRTKLTTPMRNQQAGLWSRNFPTGNRYGGYAPLSPKTVKDRQAKGWSAGPPLVRSGFLQRTVHRQSYEGIATNDGVFWNFYNVPVGSDVGVFPVWHNEGTSTMPARKFWELNAKDEALHRERAERWLTNIGKVLGGVR